MTSQKHPDDIIVNLQLTEREDEHYSENNFNSKFKNNQLSFYMLNNYSSECVNFNANVTKNMIKLNSRLTENHWLCSLRTIKVHEVQEDKNNN